MLSTMMKTLARLFNQTEQPEIESVDPSEDQFIAWAAECMLEGLNDSFLEAKMVCVQNHAVCERVVETSYLLNQKEGSEYEKFEPADHLYPVQCIEQILKGQQWSEASIHFTPTQAQFFWK